MRELIAILRGVTPAEVEAIATAVFDAGIQKIEVTLNSPNPLDSIEKLTRLFDGEAIVGAGTVLNVEQVTQVNDVGGAMIVSPNFDPKVVQASKNLKMLSYPGVFSASECFGALNAGADGLKLFPASVLGIDGLKALRAVLPTSTICYGVSGIAADSFPAWRAAGMAGFGIGSNLYKAGMSATDVKANAVKIVQAFDACTS